MASLSEVLARARTIATQMGGDPNQSPLIDDLPGIRAMLDHVLRDVYRKKAANKRNYHDLTIRHTVAIAASSGAVPSTILREFLSQADFQDANGSLISWITYPIDYASSVNFTQIGYITIRGDNFLYRAPAPNQSYTGNLYVTAVSIPALPADWSDTVDVDVDILDDVILATALAIRGQYNPVTPET